MTEGKRQKQVAIEISKELNDIFLKMGLNMMEGGMISISSVKITPDLYEARVYLSFFQVKDPEVALEKFKERSSEIRGELGKRMRHQHGRMVWQSNEVSPFVVGCKCRHAVIA